MRTLAIGDIHGCILALDSLLRVVAPVAGDRIVALGDFTDRGPDSKAVMERLIELHDGGLLIPLCGNHDEMMLDARYGGDRGLWLACGGRETLASYGHEPSDRVYDRVPERHWRFLEKDCLNWYQTDTHVFAHACVHTEIPMPDQDVWVLRWQKLMGPVAHCSGKTLVCGHTRQLSGVPLCYPKTVCIDTGVYGYDGWLTCLHVETGRYWQANQKGETRQGWLEESEG